MISSKAHVSLLSGCVKSRKCILPQLVNLFLSFTNTTLMYLWREPIWAAKLPVILEAKFGKHFRSGNINHAHHHVSISFLNWNSQLEKFHLFSNFSDKYQFNCSPELEMSAWCINLCNAIVIIKMSCKDWYFKFFHLPHVYTTFIMWFNSLFTKKDLKRMSFILCVNVIIS